MMRRARSVRPARQWRGWVGGVIAVLALLVGVVADASPFVPIHRQGGATLQDLVTRELASAKAAKQSVVIMFTADWCTPCKAIKDWVHDSKAVQKAMAKGRILLVDVDEWRGPAQSLLPGIDAQKLPQLARLDDAGKVVVSCYGTDLGIMDEGTIAKNLARLIAGKPPEAAVYDKDPAKVRDLAIADVERNKAKVAGLSAVDVQVLDVQQAGTTARYTLKVTLRNNDSRRRWFAVSGRIGAPLTEAPTVTGWVVHKFEEHVRATYLQLLGPSPMALIPVGGWGSAVLGGFIVEGAAPGNLEVWELGQLTLDGQPAQFDKKLPYALEIAAAFRTRPVFTRTTPAPVSLRAEKKHQIPLE